MLNASHYVATETLPNGLRLLIRATEPHDDLAGAIQRKVSPKSFFYRFLRPKHITVHLTSATPTEELANSQ
jgi:hypothetical protein